MSEESFELQKGQYIYPCSIALRLALRPTQPPVQWVSGVLCAGIKCLRHVSDGSPLTSAELKISGTVPLLPHILVSSWRAKEQFYLYQKWVRQVRI